MAESRHLNAVESALSALIAATEIEHDKRQWVDFDAEELGGMYDAGYLSGLWDAFQLIRETEDEIQANTLAAYEEHGVGYR